ncbi:unnamed protein product [Parajaminaea phylloscopi]
MQPHIEPDSEPMSDDGDDSDPQSFFVRALYDYTAPDDSSLSFVQGDVIEVLTQLQSGWWDGLLGDRRGWFPSNFVEVIDDDELYADGRSVSYGGHEDSEYGFDDDQMSAYGGNDRNSTHGSVYRRRRSQADTAASHQQRTEAAPGFETAASFSAATYPNDGDFSSSLGLGQDFAALRELMTAGGSSTLGGPTDAFDQLAQAAMGDPTSPMHPGSPQNAGAGYDVYRTRMTRAASGPTGRPNQLGEAIFTRPRAATGLVPPPDVAPLWGRTTNQNADAAQSQSQPMPQNLSRSENRQASKENDFWVPRVNANGEIIYFNTSTGEQSSELPEGEHDDITEEGSTPTSASGSGRTGRQRDSRASGDTELAQHSRKSSEGGDFLARFSGSSGSVALSPGLMRNHRLPLLERDYRETQEMQSLLQPPEPAQPIDMARQVLDALKDLAAICSEEVMSDGLSEADRNTGETDPSLSATGGLRLQRASQAAMSEVRRLLYATGTLLLSPSDIAAILEVTATSDGGDDRASLAALARSIVASSARGAETTVPVPTTLREYGSRISTFTSKLAVSVRAAVEQHAVKFHITDETLDRQNADRLNSLRQKVKDTATNLIAVVESLAGELTAIHLRSGSRALPWHKSVEAVLRSANGNAGISHESLGGGSAAGWKGNGFVVLPAEGDSNLRGSGDSTPERSGQDASLAREVARQGASQYPAQLLTELHLQTSVEPHLIDALSRLDALVARLDAGGSSEHPDSAANGDQTPEYTKSRHLNGETSQLREGLSVAQSGQMEDQVMHQVVDLLTRLGTFLSLIEDVNFAASLDVDGPPAPFSDAKIDHRDWESLALSARDGLQRYSGLKQGVYDASSKLLIEAQGASAPASKSEDVTNAFAAVKQSAVALQSSVKEMFGVAIDLAQIAEEQKIRQLPFIGARFRVDGADVASSAGTRDSGPAFGVNGGPGADVTSPSFEHSQRGKSTLSVQPFRDRSASVATGHSAPEQGQGKRVAPGQQSGLGTRLARRYTEGEEGSSLDGEPAKAAGARSTSSKLKKFFGEDSSVAASRVSSIPSSTPTAVSASLPEARRTKTEVETPSYLQPDYRSEDIVFTAEGQVKGATLPALVERLTMHNSFDATFNNTFLMTYRSFTSTSVLLQMLYNRALISAPPDLTEEELDDWAVRRQEPTQLRVINVLKSWIEHHFYEGQDDEYLASVKAFAVGMQTRKPSIAKTSWQLHRLVERRQGEGEQMVRKMVLPTVAPPPVLPKSLRKIKFLDIDPVEMARQLTLLESKLYNKIKPTECLDKAWSKSGSDVLAKGIKDTISTSNRITGWVAEAILVQDDLKKRVAWVKHFIAIADSCRLLQNFSTMTAIVSGLNSAPVYRLKRSWDAISGRYIAVLENLNRIMQSSKNFSDYREMIHQLQPPCVPFLGVYLTDLTFIEDGNTDRLKSDDRLINFGKRQKTAEVIREIMIYQATPYSLTPVPGIQKFIEDNLVEARSDGELYTQSLNLEPREREDEKISRLLAESGFL